jgi:hypothetical protein
MPGDYTPFPTRVDGANDNLASDVNAPNVAVGRIRTGRHSILAHNGVGDGVTDDSVHATDTDTANGGAGVSEFPAGSYRLAASITLTNALDLPPGAQFKPDAGKTLALNGPLRAGAYQIFSGAGTVVLGPGAAPDGVRPEWWGTGAAAWQSAITAAEGTGQGQGKVVCQPGTTYTLAGGLTCKRSTIIDLCGATITCTSTTATLFTIASPGDTSWNPGTILGPGNIGGSGGTSTGLQVGSGTSAAHNVAASRVNIYGFGQNVVYSSTGGQAFLETLDHCAVSQAVNDGIVLNDPGAENIQLLGCDVFANGNTTGKSGLTSTTANPPEVHVIGGSFDGNGNGTVGQIYVPSTAAIELYLSDVHMEWTSGSAFAPCSPHIDIRSAAANPSYVRVSKSHLLQGTGGSVKNQPLVFIRSGELVIDKSTLDGNDLTVGLVTLGDSNNEAVYCRTVNSRLYNAAGVNAATQYHSIVSTAVTFEWAGNQINAQVGSLSGIYYTTSGAQHTFKDTTANGANVKLIGNGATTPSKVLRVSGGHFQILNDAYSGSVLDIDDAGNTVLPGTLQFGGTRAISRTYAANPSLNFGTVAANSTAELTTAMTGVQSGDWIVVNPAFAIPAGVTWGGYCTTNGTVTVRVANVTGAGVAVSGTFRIWTIA